MIYRPVTPMRPQRYIHIKQKNTLDRRTWMIGHAPAFESTTVDCGFCQDTGVILILPPALHGLVSCMVFMILWDFRGPHSYDIANATPVTPPPRLPYFLLSHLPSLPDARDCEGAACCYELGVASCLDPPILGSK